MRRCCSHAPSARQILVMCRRGIGVLRNPIDSIRTARVSLGVLSNGSHRAPALFAGRCSSKYDSNSKLPCRIPGDRTEVMGVGLSGPFETSPVPLVPPPNRAAISLARCTHPPHHRACRSWSTLCTYPSAHEASERKQLMPIEERSANSTAELDLELERLPVDTRTDQRRMRQSPTPHP